VVLAEHRRAVAVELQDAGDRGGGLRKGGVIARKSARRVAKLAHADLMRVPSGQKRGARGRADRRRMKAVEDQAVTGEPVEVGRRHRAAEGARRAETHVVGHDEKHIGRARRRLQPRRPVRAGLRRHFGDFTAERLVGQRQHAARRLRGAGRSRGQDEERAQRAAEQERGPGLLAGGAPARRADRMRCAELLHGFLSGIVF